MRQNQRLLGEGILLKVPATHHASPPRTSSLASFHTEWPLKLALASIRLAGAFSSVDENARAGALFQKRTEKNKAPTHRRRFLGFCALRSAQLVLPRRMAFSGEKPEHQQSGERAFAVLTLATDGQVDRRDAFVVIDWRYRGSSIIETIARIDWCP